MSTFCYGGSFNPIHHGHLLCARAVAESLGVGPVWLVPTGNPPHKPASPDLAAPQHRLEMCRLAIEHDPAFRLTDIECSNPEPSYTIQTVRHLKRLGHTDISWLIGADMLLYLPKWRDAEQLLSEVNFVVMHRPGWHIDWHTLPAPFQKLRANLIGAPMVDISASDIRRRISAGSSVRYLTPDAVCAYIAEKALYRGSINRKL